MKITACLTFLFVLSGCLAAGSDVIDSEAEALSLLNSGAVTQIGISHDGWTMLTLKDGKTRSNKAEIIGSPYTLLRKCSDCSGVSQWIE